MYSMYSVYSVEPAENKSRGCFQGSDALVATAAMEGRQTADQARATTVFLPGVAVSGHVRRRDVRGEVEGVVVEVVLGAAGVEAE